MRGYHIIRHFKLDIQVQVLIQIELNVKLVTFVPLRVFGSVLRHESFHLRLLQTNAKSVN